MFEFDNIDGSVHVRCAVTAYQFPASRADDWVMVDLLVQQGAESFEKLDAALEAGDLRALRDWFRALADDRIPRRVRLTFIEPCLAFELQGKTAEGVRIAQHLAAELRPTFPLRQLGQVTKEWAVVFALSSEQLARVADAWEDAARRLPVRSR